MLVIASLKLSSSPQLRSSRWKQSAACRDPKDNKFLELAVAGSAGYLISGDEDLLVLNPFRGIRIVTPAEFTALASKELQ